MESPPPSSDHGGPGGGGDADFDPSKPFKGIVVCCTSIPPEQRTDIANKTAELGGVHKYDLTPDVTHLVVGDYDTAKYRHVAKERSDIRPMAMGWVEAVRSLWTEDEDMDFAGLEKEWSLKPLETHGGEPTTQFSAGVERGKLLCCLTGFDDAEVRQSIIDKIHANGGDYTGDLTRQVTHLIVAKAEGRKYTAAKTWNVHTVSVEWLDDSVARGMILDEKCYDPTLPKEERGKNAWIRRDSRRASLGKRLRDVSGAQDDGRRKLRKTASMKLNNQRDNLWDDILGKGPFSAGGSAAQEQEVKADEGSGRPALERQDSSSAAVTSQARETPLQNIIAGPPFTSCFFYVHGFPKPQTEILISTVTSLGGQVAASIADLGNESQEHMHRLIIVPQSSSSDTHPTVPNGAHLVTEFFIERCMHKKRFFPPAEAVIGRPFPVFPIIGFGKLKICTAGFTGVDLNQVDKAIRQLGAAYEERFTAQSSVLICTSLDTVRRQKLDLAVVWKVPAVTAQWLWDCITAGVILPIKGYMFPQLRQSETASWEIEEGQKTQPLVQETARPAPEIPTAKAEPQPAASDSTATPFLPTAAPALETFQTASNEPRFETAPTHQSAEPGTKEPSIAGAGSRPTSRHSTTAGAAAPLTELSASSINKSASPPKRKTARKSLSRIPSEIADSETAGDDEEDNNDDDNGGGGDDVLARKRLEQQQRAAVEERLALSTRLTSLLEATATTTTPGGGASGARSFSEGLGPRPAGGGDDDAAAAASARPARRKRGIMGRAISNVSAASSGSVESSSVAVGNSAAAASAAAAGRTASAAAAAQLSISGGLLGGEQQGQSQQGDDADRTRLSLTQVEYEAPDAQRYKAQLLSKMTGGKEGAGWREGGGEEERLTMKDYGMAIQAEKNFAAAAAGGGTAAAGGMGTRRTTRRRG